MSRIDAYILSFLAIPADEWIDPYYPLSLRQEQELYRLCSPHDLEAVNDGEGHYAGLGNTPKERVLAFLGALKDLRIN